METRVYQEEKHLGLIEDWFISHRKKPIEVGFIPTLGCMVYSEAKPLLYAGLYVSNSKVGQIGWMVSNPKSSARERVRAIAMATVELQEKAKELGCEFCFMLTDQSAISKIAEADGFMKMQAHEFLIKRLVEYEDSFDDV